VLEVSGAKRSYTIYLEIGTANNPGKESRITKALRASLRLMVLNPKVMVKQIVLNRFQALSCTFMSFYSLNPFSTNHRARKWN
jgi:hypothetical protein